MPMAYLSELSQNLTGQALDQFDKLLGELMRKGERRQEQHFRLNARKLNSHLTSVDAPVGEEKLVLVAALMGMGMNLGLTKMDQSCPYTYRQLA
jgi:hypothetical protein